MSSALNRKTPEAEAALAREERSRRAASAMRVTVGKMQKESGSSSEQQESKVVAVSGSSSSWERRKGERGGVAHVEGVRERLAKSSHVQQTDKTSYLMT